jgi:endonuclease/exonuclease/phosphatase family metal-dependent hydrolase
MRRLILALGAFCATAGGLSAETLRVTTWNMEWFPSGAANRRDDAEEARRILEAAAVLKSLNPDVALLQEVRDWDTCEKLTQSLQPSKYYVAVCSAFREGFGGQIGWQQEAIIAKKPAQSAWSESWKIKGTVDPPRGFAFAVFRFGEVDVGFYSVHLKSNLVRGNAERQSQLNILKRELASEQLISHVVDVQRRLMPSVKAVVVGGDFNTNRDQPLFLSEKTLDCLSQTGFKSAFSESLPLAQRITHPGKGKYPDATFDYLFLKGLEPVAAPKITPVSVSDHRPVTCEIKIPALISSTAQSSRKK